MFEQKERMISDFMQSFKSRQGWADLYPNPDVLSAWSETMGEPGSHVAQELSAFLLFAQALPVRYRDLYVSYVLDSFEKHSLSKSAAKRTDLLACSDILQLIHRYRNFKSRDCRWFLVAEGWCLVFAIVRLLKLAFDQVCVYFFCGEAG